MILVTGGSGYVGRYVRKLLTEQVVVIDDLENVMDTEPPFLTMKLSEDRFRYGLSGVVHMGAKIDQAESFQLPEKYWLKNFAETVALVRDVPDVPYVFTSSAAVYGSDGATPDSPYGNTKKACEVFLGDAVHPLAILRVFNVAGGHENHRRETHLIPKAVRAALTGELLEVYGDGRSDLRDYVHVEDVAQAHVLALGKSGTVDIGTGVGRTVLDVIQEVEAVSGRLVNVKFLPRRRGDPGKLIADPAPAKKLFGWEPKKSFRQIVESCYEFLSGRPDICVVK